MARIKKLKFMNYNWKNNNEYITNIYIIEWPIFNIQQKKYNRIIIYVVSNVVSYAHDINTSRSYKTQLQII